MNGLPVSACSVLALDAAGTEVLTIEGLASNGELDAIQKAFIKHGAFQCAFCTSGLILAVKVLLQRFPTAGEQRARQFLAGNICRCGAHPEILEAVRWLQSQATKEA
jgi:carbon-monoxide dehydrogenase small subunit